MIYIDCGAYDGDTIKQFLNWGLMIGNPQQAEIYAFEPNPDMKKPLEDLASQHKGVVYLPQAVWIKDTKIAFAVDKNESAYGSTLMPGKRAIWDHYPKVPVEAIDFSNWLKSFYLYKNAEVIIKMDIEGAEFPVLEKMIDDGTIHIPRILMVEFHPNKVQEYTTTDKDKLVGRIKDLGVNLKEWH